MSKIRTYSEMLQYSSFDDRFAYLRLKGDVGRSTFGFDRHVNQRFYTSHEWKQARDTVIIRDEGCDLGVYGYDIGSHILIHHMNPLSLEDIVHGEEWIFNPEFLITTTRKTHNAIHYGVDSKTPKVVAVRTPNDTKLW